MPPTSMIRQYNAKWLAFSEVTAQSRLPVRINEEARRLVKVVTVHIFVFEVLSALCKPDTR